MSDGAESVRIPLDLPAVVGAELELGSRQVATVVELLDGGATVPFIARYRKEASGGLDETQIERIEERRKFHREFVERKETILQSMLDGGHLTDELRAQVVAATTRVELEDLYLPFRPKRRTRATMAKEKGLEPLAERMLAHRENDEAPESAAAAFVDAEKGVETIDDALQGARDIVAEIIAETAPWRASIRDLTWKEGTVRSAAARGKAKERSKFEDYYDFEQRVRDIPSHRVLAMRRGESEGFLRMRIAADPARAQALLRRQVIERPRSPWAEQLCLASDDALERLLSAQIETEIRLELKHAADARAVDVFAGNLSELLMAAPFGARPVLAIDPGYRTGCKVAILDPTGRLLEHGVIYPTPPRKDVEGSRRALESWRKRHGFAAVAIGNGTGGRETFDIVRDYAAGLDAPLTVVLVNESGASIYSASEIAREELPDQDVTVRGAVSIGRRLQDPLAELVKIDPKSIGVGQYQHDVDQRLLKERLDTVVRSCVNAVGVDLNTASASLLSHVSGLGPRLARAIVDHREKSGAFGKRKQLMAVAGLGPKTFEQAAGFLRVKGGHPLDDSAVHPERYALVERIAKELGRPLASLVGDESVLGRIELDRYLDDEVGRYTLEDILAELRKPGRDPRDDFAAVEFDDNVREMADLRAGMALAGVVTNVTNFGAFVDIGVHQDGLVHVSQIAHRFVNDPADELHVGQTLRVQVLDVDQERGRIGLSIKALLPPPTR